jgi:beta-glucosidase
LPRALERGLVTIEMIDTAVRRVLTLTARLGLFADPYRRCGPAEISADTRKARRALAYEAACRSIVLLTNRDDALPLRNAARRIAVIGPLADGKGDAPQAQDSREIIVRDGLRAALPEATLAFAQGCLVARGNRAALAEARALARDSDQIVLCLGETMGMSGEASSRTHPGLPEAQCALARTVIAQGKPVVVLLFSGRPLVLPDWLVAKAAAILAVWFPGHAAGAALGDVLSGRFNPSGRLTMSWPVDVGQIPVFFAERPTGRPPLPKEHYSSKYLDMPNEPRFAFGHGLSYSRFTLSGLRLDRAAMRPGEAVEIAVDVANGGPLAGEATVFLFLRDRVSSITRPALELKDFGKITLEAGARGTVRFRLGSDDLRFLGPDLRPMLEAGAFDILVGESARVDGLLQGRLDLLDGTENVA